MWGQTVKALSMIAILSVFAADFTVGCGHEYVYGPVSQKLMSSLNDNAGERRIVVNGGTFDVPVSFYNQIQVGDWVRFDGRTWTIAKPPAPASSSP